MRRDNLTLPLSENELWICLKSMRPYKAPGLDGIQLVFLQTQWSTIKSSFTKFAQDIFQGCHPIEHVNRTLITLIPKVLAPERISEFQPIGLYNVSYKILSKVLVNRVKNLLPSLIGEEQTSFISGRFITDNVIIVQEDIHSM